MFGSKASILSLLTVVPMLATANAEDFLNYTNSYKTPQFFDQNETALNARIKLLDQVPAGGTAKVMTFVYENGVATRHLAAHMCLAAKRGVKVQFMPDSKTGDRPGIDDAFDSDTNYQINEEVYQMLANCGVEVRIHNHIPNFEQLQSNGKRIPLMNQGVLGTAGSYVYNDLGTLGGLNKIISDLGSVMEEEISLSAKADQEVFSEIKSGFVSLLRQSLVSYAINRLEENRLDSILKVLQEAQAKVISSEALKKLNPDKIKTFISNVLTRVQNHESLGKFYRESRKFNRLNHRKLFWVESDNRSCFFMGGRNLGDHYLTWGKHHDEFMDGDVLICNSHLKTGDQAVTAQAKASFDQLWFNQDSEDPVNVKPILTLIKPNYKYKFKYIFAPHQTDATGKPIDDSISRLFNDPGIARADRTVPKPYDWKNSLAVMGREITGSMNWRVKTSTWNTKKDAVRAELYQAINNEQELIYIETAYSEFSTEFRSHLENALKRNIPVHVVTNSIYVSDAGSKAIRLVMARWTRQMLEKYPRLFKVEFASIGFGHMIHFKGASFQCQKSGNRTYRLNLVGSHNFHGRSGYSDKEHAIIWEQSPKVSCLNKMGLKSQASTDLDLMDMRNDFYKNLTAKSKQAPLKKYLTFEEEIQDGIRSGKLSESRQKISQFLLHTLYQHEKGSDGKLRIKRVAGKALLKAHDSFMDVLELFAESGVSDLVGALL